MLRDFIESRDIQEQALPYKKQSNNPSNGIDSNGSSLEVIRVHSISGVYAYRYDTV